MSEDFRDQDTDFADEGSYIDNYWKRQAQIFKTSYVNLIIIALNIIVFVYSYFAGDDFINRYEQDSYLVVFGHQYYRLITSMFLHGGIGHLGNNLLYMLVLGAYVEYDLGHICYIILYFFSGIAGNLMSVAFDFYSGSFIPSIGASGATFGITGAVVIIAFFGRKRLRFKGSNLMVRLMVIVALSLYSGFSETGIDNAAHIGGLLGGLVITLLMTIILKKEYTMEEWI